MVFLRFFGISIYYEEFLKVIVEHYGESTFIEAFNNNFPDSNDNKLVRRNFRKLPLKSLADINTRAFIRIYYKIKIAWL